MAHAPRLVRQEEARHDVKGGGPVPGHLAQVVHGVLRHLDVGLPLRVAHAPSTATG